MTVRSSGSDIGREKTICLSALAPPSLQLRCKQKSLFVIEDSDYLPGVGSDKTLSLETKNGLNIKRARSHNINTVPASLQYY